MLRKTASRMLITTAFGFALTGAATVMARPPEAKLTLEHSFAAEEGKWPSLEGSLVQGRGHKIYGVLASGGPNGNGSAYSFNVNNGHFKVLHAFAPDEVTDRTPSAIVVDSSGAILVTTFQGGAVHVGTISRLEDDGSVTVVHSFDGDGGGTPTGRLTVVGDSIFGTTESGPLGFGTVYRFRSNGEFELLHAFESASSYEESFPYGITMGTSGTLYGATNGFVLPWADKGALYSLTAAGEYQVLHYFTGPDGARPYFAPVIANNGDLLGTAWDGGEFGCGVIYRLHLPATLTVVHSFNYDIDGCMPFGGLVRSANGKFYGTTYVGGGSGVGTFFELSPNGTFRTLLDFDADRRQGNMQSMLLEVEPGTFYGASANGGRYGLGQIFRIKLK